MRTLLLSAVGAVSVAIATTDGVRADDTGFINIHELRREGRLRCTVDHYHSGQGTAQKTKKKAIRSAAVAWSEFTAWEYGTDWAKWRYARSKAVSCDGPKGDITCSVEARPCKPLRGKRRRRG
ncbi:MAG: hypothetical protein AAGB04_23860 [Pseudomonadota bacterium]